MTNNFYSNLPDLPSLQRLLTYHKQISRKYDNLDKYELLMLKRSINTAIVIIEAVELLKFEDLELAIYMNTSDTEMLELMRLYEYQLEEAKLNPDNFLYNLHNFYFKTGRKILKNPRNFFDFIDFVNRMQRNKSKYANIFDAYISLLLQQCTYLGFLKGYREKLCCGLSTNNEILFKDDVFPYSDMANYELENELYHALKNGKDLNLKRIKEAYKKYGYEINRIEDIEYIDMTGRMFDNNHHLMIPYINENTFDMLPNTLYEHHIPEFPRIWVETSLLLEKLQKRKYCLPTDGVIAKFYNAGEIKEIQFKEIYKDNKIILLYKVFGYRNNEFSGFFDTKTQDFYSIYERTNQSDQHEIIKAFILENYYTLTCEQTIDKKRLTVLLQVDDINQKHFENYGNQPVVSYLYKKTETKKGNTNTILKHYDKDKYKSEKKFVNHYIRKLPKGQKASLEATQAAIQLGYELADDETFVKPFEKQVIKIKEL